MLKRRHLKIGKFVSLLVCYISLFLVCCSSDRCNRRSTNTQGGEPLFYAAFTRNDGKIQMNMSTDGTVWNSKIVLGLEDRKKPKYGPGIATDYNKRVALAYIYRSNPLGQKVLVVEENYFAQQWWAPDSTTWDSLPVEAGSAPAICHMNDRIYAVAWNNGNGKIVTTTVNMGAETGNLFSGTNLIRGAGGIKNAPSIAFNGEKALAVWLSDSGDKINCATGRLYNREVKWQNKWEGSSHLNLSGQVGAPELAWNGSKFLLAFSGKTKIETDDGDPLWTSWIRIYKSENGVSWTQISSKNYADHFVRRCAIASAKDTPTVLLISPVSDMADGEVCAAWSGSNPFENIATWSSRFGDRGKHDKDPSITYKQAH